MIAYPVLAPHTAYRWDLVHGEHQIVHPQARPKAARISSRERPSQRRMTAAAASFNTSIPYGKVTEEHVDALLQALARRSLIRDVQAEPLLRHP